MKKRQEHQSATSLPQAPEEEAAHRLKRYALTMGIRTLCFILMAAVTPYGWYTWVFAAGAIVLPYVAVVVANSGTGTRYGPAPEAPAIALAAPAPPSRPDDQPPTVILLTESPSDNTLKTDASSREEPSGATTPPSADPSPGDQR